MNTTQVAAVAGIGAKNASEQVLRIARKIGIPIENGDSGWPVAFDAEETIMIAVTRALVNEGRRQRSYSQFRQAARSVARRYVANTRPAWLVIVGVDHSVWSESSAVALSDELLAHRGAMVIVLRLGPIFARLEATMEAVA